MDLNIRDVPAEIMRSLRVDAAAEGISIKELCLRRLVPDGGASWRPQTVTGEPIKERIKKVKRELEFAAYGVEESRVPESKPKELAKIIEPETACKCGANGVMLVGGKRKCANCNRERGA